MALARSNILGRAAGYKPTQAKSTAISTDITHNTTSYATVNGVALTIQSRGGPILVSFNGPLHTTGAKAHVTFGADGVDGNILANVATTVANTPFAIQQLYTPSAGVHTYTVRVKMATGGTLTMNMGTQANGVFTVREFDKEGL